MHNRMIPEDSVLRRHFQSAAAMKSAAWLQQSPTDSVLKRHYDQLRGMQPRRDTPAVSNSAPAPAPAPAPTPAPQVLTAASTQTGESGGFFGWLRRLFG